MSFQKYPEYKDSEVEWIGEVPATWEVKPFKWLLSHNDGGVWGDDPSGENDTLVLRSTDQTVDGNWRINDPALRKLSAKEKADALLVEGDLVVTKSSGSSLHIGKTTLVTAEIAKQGCCYGNFMQRLRVNSSFTPKLAWYVMNNELARCQLDLLSNSTTGLANLNGTLIGEILLPVSTVAEQTQIARFLDHETASIDALIEEQLRLIELLKEKRQAVISHAVTKGLDPSVPMKDSGVEWLGKVPAHWNVKALRHLGVCQNGINIGGEAFGSGTPFVSYGDVYKNDVLPETVAGLVESSNDDKQRYSVKAGDVFFTRTSETIDEIGFSATCLKEIPEAVFAGFLIRFRPNGESISQNFSKYYFRNQGLRAFFNKEMNLVTRASLSQDLLKLMPVTLPPITEQINIANFLDAIIEGFSSLLAQGHESINLLIERRSALISAAVTGKIDLRDWQPPASTTASIREQETA